MTSAKVWQATSFLDTSFLTLVPIATKVIADTSYLNTCIFHTIVETPYFNGPQLAECLCPQPPCPNPLPKPQKK